MASVTFAFESETFPDRQFVGGEVSVGPEGISVDGTVVAEPSEEGLFVLTAAAGQYAGQVAGIADLEE